MVVALPEVEAREAAVVLDGVVLAQVYEVEGSRGGVEEGADDAGESVCEQGRAVGCDEEGGFEVGLGDLVAVARAATCRQGCLVRELGRSVGVTDR